MRLADFIDAHVEAIVDAAEAFAATLLPAAARLDPAALRDHLPLILQAVAADLRMPQTAEEAVRKSEGRAPGLAGAPETAAQTHALLRARDGFRIEQLVAEYRALRAGVLRLWQHSEHSLDAQAFADMVRFNEAIDQAVAESVDVFTREVDLLRSALPGHPIDYRAEGWLQGDFDASRIREALGNLVTNAAKYGRSGSPVRVKLVSDAEAVRLRVANEGAPLDAAALEALFEPLRRGSGEPGDRRLHRTTATWGSGSSSCARSPGRMEARWKPPPGRAGRRSP